MFDSPERLSQLHELLEELPAFHVALSDVPEASSEAEVPANWLDGMAEAAYLIAAADGGLGEQDVEGFRRGLAAVSEGRLAPARTLLAIERVQRKVHDHVASQLFHEIAELVPETPLREAVFLVASATILDRASPSQRQTLAQHALGHAFGFSEGKIQQLVARLRHSV
ncbi:MAG TPA: hypothetical protein VK524_19340 [Polyangiaceae bacterium]|nr:hypothetical protein [Polyangiaceae bacterium]